MKSVVITISEVAKLDIGPRIKWKPTRRRLDSDSSIHLLPT